MAIASIEWINKAQKKPVAKLMRHSETSATFKLTPYGTKFIKRVYGVDAKFLRYVYRKETLNKNGERYL